MADWSTSNRYWFNVARCQIDINSTSIDVNSILIDQSLIAGDVIGRRVSL